MRSLNYNGEQRHVFICLLLLFFPHRCKFMPWGFERPNTYLHKFTSTLLPDLGVITWEQNGFISFNPAGTAICTGNICICRVDRVKQLENSGSLKCKQRAIIKTTTKRQRFNTVDRPREMYVLRNTLSAVLMILVSLNAHSFKLFNILTF